MSKPRIIIADGDVNYILPLQLKFVEEYFEEIDLEVITDESYFSELFSSPQQVDLLIISEDLYTQTIHRHNIGHIFVMTEQYEEDQTAELNINRIFKYTSVKEIFNEITGKCTDVFIDKAGKKQETQVILVYSASGGTGKTTVALGVSAALTKNYKRVLYINAARLQVFQYMMENSTPISASDVYAILAKAPDDMFAKMKHVIRKEIFSYLPPFKASLMSLGLAYSVFEKIIDSAKKSGAYDFIIVDADVTFDEDKAKLINQADKVLVVTKQSIAAVSATNALVSNVNGMSGDKYIFLCNDFDKENNNALISPMVSLKFKVSDYIDHFRLYEQMKLDDLSRESSIQRVAYLVI